MKASLLLLLCLPLWGAQSLEWSGMTGTATASATVPGTSWLALRLHTWSAPMSGSRILYENPGVTISLNSDSTVTAVNRLDTLSIYGNTSSVNISGISDVTLLVYRNLTVGLLQWSITAVNTQTAAVTLSSCGGQPVPCPIDSASSSSWGGSVTITPGGAISAKVAWIKWATGALPATMVIQSTTADLANYLLDGSGVDAARGNNLALSGASYSTTPTFAPVSIPRTTSAVPEALTASARSGQVNQLDATYSYSTQDDPTLTYVWRQVGTPAVFAFSSYTASQPTYIAGPFGQYSFQLQVTDTSGWTGTTILDVGAVATDSNGVVSEANSVFQAILQDQIAFGRSPWSWLDSRHAYMADFFGALQTSQSKFPGDTLATGTLTMTDGSGVIAGSGTDFTSNFTCGTDLIGVNFTVGGVPTSAAFYTDPGCDADALDMGGSDIWEIDADECVMGTCAGLTWYRITPAQASWWANSSNNVNYYDNVQAHYSLWRRSGLTKYRDYARYLASRWSVNPFAVCFDCLYAVKMEASPRMRSQAGLVLWKEDTGGSASNTSLLRRWAAADSIRAFSLVDLREMSFYTSQLSTMSIPAVEPNAGLRATNLAHVESWLGSWASNRLPLGSGLRNNIWQSTGNFSYLDSRPTGATVTIGSPDVTSSGAFPAGICNGPWIQFGTESPFAFDSIGFHCTRTDDSNLVLKDIDGNTVNYQGTDPGAGLKGWNAANLVGPGVQPFILGINNSGFRFASLVVPASLTTLQEYQSTNMNWQLTYASNGNTVKGIYYARIHGGCEPDSGGGAGAPATTPQCYGTDGNAATRAYAYELIPGCSAVQIFAPDADRKAFCDQAVTVLLGKPGYTTPVANPDAFYDEDMNNNFGYTSANPDLRKPKYLGFIFGTGGMATWAAARVGGLAAASNRNVIISMVRPSAADATVCTLTSPNGSTAEYTYSTLPGTAVVNSTLGDYTAVCQHKAGSVVLASVPLRLYAR